MVAAVVIAVAVTLIVVLGAFLMIASIGRSLAAPPKPSGKPAAPGAAAPAGEPGYLDPRTIRVGDTVGVQGTRYRCIGALTVTWQGENWTEYFLEDADRRVRSLTVEERRGGDGGDVSHLAVILWTPIPTEGMIPAKRMLIVDGVEFHPVERGTAAFRSEGITRFPDRGLLDFADYRSADGRMLSFQRAQGGRWEACYAQPLPPGTITVERATRPGG